MRNLFAGQSWWGKLLGAFFGYVMSGPAGALFGLLIGNLFDIGLTKHYSRPHWHYHSERQKKAQNVFFTATFSILGYIAKADGRVSESEINMARQLMRELNLSNKQRRIAIDCFTQGKQSDFSLEKTLIHLNSVCQHKQNLLKLFADIQYRAAHVDGLTLSKIDALNTIFRHLGFAPLHKQHRFHQDHGAYHQHTASDTPTDHVQTDSPYDVLEVPRNASKQEIKSAYRRLMSQNHPDKLIAQGLPEAMIKLATDKTQTIQKAYDKIKKEKGF